MSLQIIIMEFVKSKWSGLVKSYKHLMNPNENPTDVDKQAFDLINKGQVDMFIDFVQNNPVNIHVCDPFTKVSFLIKAQDVANDTHPVKKLLSQEERTARAIKATQYLLKKGVNINYRDKSGGTALQASAHWNNFEIAKILLQYGADPNIGSEGIFLNYPLISATFKNNKDMIIMLVSYGADVDKTLQLIQKNKGFPITQEQKDLLSSASNLQALIRRRRYEMAMGKKTVLSMLSQIQFQQICFYV